MPLTEPHPVSAALYQHPALAAMLHEALALLGDGVVASSIEAAALQQGWSVGPLALMDQLGLGPIDTALHAQGHSMHAPHDHAHHGCCGHSHEHEHHPLRPQTLTESAIYVVEKMAHGYRRQGLATGSGFYDYHTTPPELWSGLKAFERQAVACSPGDVADRLLWSALLAALELDAPPHDGALAACLGAAFPTHQSAALARIEALGNTVFQERAQVLAQKFGSRFTLSAAQLARLLRT
jgi:3-hydroxyacyl-CoA dehydrogenase/enoyl-CoA hydratase/3-hydroxybutyryl-CoA epimerase